MCVVCILNMGRTERNVTAGNAITKVILLIPSLKTDQLVLRKL